MGRSEQGVDVSRALTVVGLCGATLGISTVLLSAALYAQDHPFSLATTYLSDMGAEAGWAQVVFNSGMLLIAPVRYLFLVLLVLQLAHAGSSRLSSVAILFVGAAVVAGSVGIAAVPYTLDVGLHETSANVYFFGVVGLQSLIAFQEWHHRWPRLLPASSLLVVAIYLVFALLLALVDKTEGITRSTPVIWEWLAFGALMLWLIVHSIIQERGPEVSASQRA